MCQYRAYKVIKGRSAYAKYIGQSKWYARYTTSRAKKLEKGTSCQPRKISPLHKKLIDFWNQLWNILLKKRGQQAIILAKSIKQHIKDNVTQLPHQKLPR